MFNKITIALLFVAIWLGSKSAAEAGSQLFGDRVLAIMNGNLNSGR